MPERRTIQRARAQRRRGRSAGTAAGEFVREEIEHVRQGKHGVRSTKQAIAIGLSKARQAGIDVPARGAAGRKRKKKARRSGRKSSTRSRAVKAALRREPRRGASKAALSRFARSRARRRTKAQRSASARKAARTRARRR